MPATRSSPAPPEPALERTTLGDVRGALPDVRFACVPFSRTGPAESTGGFVRRGGIGRWAGDRCCLVPDPGDVRAVHLSGFRPPGARPVGSFAISGSAA